MMKAWRLGIVLSFAWIVLFVMLDVQESMAESYNGSQAKVLVDSLNVRNDGSLEGDVIASLHKGTVVQAFETAHGWVKIQYGEVEGWTAGYYLSIEDSIEDSPSQEGSSEISSSAITESEASSMLVGHVNVDALRLRQGPSLDHQILTLLPKGTTLSIVEQQDEWLNVAAGSEETGWVYSEYVSTEKPLAEPEIAAAAAVDLSVEALLNPSTDIAGKVIVIDPGHGGVDGGAVGIQYDTLESEINLTTAFYLEQELIDLGANVVMTRIDNEKKVSLEERVEISQKYNADAFVSIHYNAAIVPASGTIAFYHSNSKDLPLARAIDRHLDKSNTLPHNGVAFGEYHVLRRNQAPAVLIELGFLSNESDEEIIRTSQYQQQAARIIADALHDYFSS